MKKYIVIVIFILCAESIAAQTINYNYDSLGRLTQVIYPDSSVIKYAYDATGNRLNKTVIKSPIVRACPQSNVTFFAGTNDTSKNYQWQADTANGFVNIIPNTFYTGVDSSTLTLNTPPSTWYNYKYRCIISDLNSQTTSPVFTLKFEVSWTGTSDTAWENTANWSCGSLPDSNTDVIIIPTAIRFPQVNSNVSCRSLALQHGSAILVKLGYSIDIRGKK